MMGRAAGSTTSRSMKAQVSSTPDWKRSGTEAVPGIVVANPVLRAEERVCLRPHARMVDTGQPAVPRDELLSGQAAPARQGTQLGDLHTVAGDVIGLTRLDGVH